MEKNSEDLDHEKIGKAWIKKWGTDVETLDKCEAAFMEAMRGILWKIGREADDLSGGSKPNDALFASCYEMPSVLNDVVDAVGAFRVVFHKCRMTAGWAIEDSDKR